MRPTLVLVSLTITHVKQRDGCHLSMHCVTHNMAIGVKLHFLGDIYRPPFEEKSLLIPVSAGCSHNRCKFCNLYGETEFRVNTLGAIDEDISSTNQSDGFLQK